MMKPLSSVRNVYSILLADEKQRQISSVFYFGSIFASFNVNAGITSKPKFLSKVNFDNPRSSHNPQNSQSSLFCKYCKKNNHTIVKIL